MTSKNEAKLQLAREHFLAYRFRPAYHLYRQLFSTLPFQLDEQQLEHIGCYARVLLELDKREELRFYIPTLEKYFAQRSSDQIEYALGYIYLEMGEKKRPLEMFDRLRLAAADSDLRIKAAMMAAKLVETDEESIRLIHSIRDTARDPLLANLLEVWYCIILRCQGNAGESIQRLQRFMSKLSTQPGDSYCLLAAKEALVRALLDQLKFHEARQEIETFSTLAESLEMRTARMHQSILNGVYNTRLGSQTIRHRESAGCVELSYEKRSVQIQNSKVRGVIEVFKRTPELTVRKVRSFLNVSEAQFEEIARAFLDKLDRLALPPDSLVRNGARIQFLPALAQFNPPGKRRIQCD